MSLPYGVGLWKPIRNPLPEFSTKTTLRIGNGIKIYFWNGNWLGSGALVNLFLIFTGSINNKKLQLERYGVLKAGPLTFRRSLFDWEMGRVVELYKMLEQFTGTADY